MEPGTNPNGKPNVKLQKTKMLPVNRLKNDGKIYSPNVMRCKPTSLDAVRLQVVEIELGVERRQVKPYTFF
jgi:hypothetical protein